jgi:hypothetical protein
MRNIKRPESKRNDPITPWEQKTFRNVFKDIPATEIPEGGVAEAENILLFGDRAVARPGDIKFGTNTLPTEKTITGVTKSIRNCDGPAYTFLQDDVGKFLIWANGKADMIRQIATDGSSAFLDKDNSEGSEIVSHAVMRAQIYGLFWHEKSSKVILHIGKKLYWSHNTMLGGWNEIPLPVEIELSESRSKFDAYEDSIYLFNNKIYLIDVSNESSVFAVHINSDVYYSNISPGDGWVYPDASGFSNTDNGTNYTKESNRRRYGKRYLSTLSRLSGDWRNNRQTEGVVIKKETGSNLIRSDGNDFRESWTPLSFGAAEKQQFRAYNVGWTGVGVVSFLRNGGESVVGLSIKSYSSQSDLTGTTTTRDVFVNFTDVIDLYHVAELLQAAILLQNFQNIRIFKYMLQMVPDYIISLKIVGQKS